MIGEDTIRVGSERPSDGKQFSREFQLEKITGSFIRTIMTIEETSTSRIINGVEKLSVIRKLVPVQEEFTEGYMIYYPQGHSIFVAADDTAQLMLLGVTNNADTRFVDNYEDVENTFSALSPKEAVQKAERKRGRSTVGGIEAAMRGE